MPARRDHAAGERNVRPSTWLFIVMALALITCIVANFGVVGQALLRHRPGLPAPRVASVRVVGDDIYSKRVKGFKRLYGVTTSFHVPRPTTTQKPAIALLMTAGGNDIADLKHNLGGLGRALPLSIAPILMFHEGDVGQDLQRELAAVLSQGGYRGEARFHEVHFDLPRNCCSFEPIWSKRPDRGKFAYQNMIRFWIKDVWHHPALDEFDTVMRLDTDSEIRAQQPAGDQLPGLAAGVTYRGNVLLHDHPDMSQHFGEFINKTLAQWPHRPKNPEIITNFTMSLRTRHTVPIIYNNFFVSRVEFFRRPRVVELVDKMCCEAPEFHVYRYRWGDAFLHYFLLGMEAYPSEFLVLPPVGYLHAGLPMSHYLSNNA